MHRGFFRRTFSNILTVVFCIGFLTMLQAAAPVLKNDIFWKDLSGNPIYSQGGGVFKFGDTWYWYGVKYDGAVTYCANPAKRVSSTVFNAVTCYSSKDLVNWKFENDILSAEKGGKLDPSIWVGRLGVAYNENTKKYVLITQYQGTPNTTQLFATCSTPNGKFTVDHTQAVIENVVNSNAGDQTVFVDEDGKAYLVFSSQSGRANTYVAQLRASDYLAVEPATKVFGGASREGNCLFKYRGRYYICSSDLHGWNASHCYYISAEKILGPYSSEAVMINSDLDFCHVTQTGFFITVNGTKDTTVLFCGDRWCDFAGNGIGFNQWCPLTFEGTKPVFNSLTNYHFDATAGTWSIAAENNFVLNGSFEADRVTQNKLAGWTNSSSISGGDDPNSNASGAHTGNFCMQQKYTSAYKATMYQELKGISNGTYALTAWVQSSGGQNSCRVYAADFGGSEKGYDINKVINTWTKVIVTDIAITNGSCKVGIISDAKAGNWCKIDDISLVKTDQVNTTLITREVKSIQQGHNIQLVVNHDFRPHDGISLRMFTLGGRCIGVLNSGEINRSPANLAPGVYTNEKMLNP